MTIHYQNTENELRETISLATREFRRDSRLMRVIVMLSLAVGGWIGYAYLLPNVPTPERTPTLIAIFISGISFILLMGLMNIFNIIRTRAWRNLWTVVLNLFIAGFLVGEWIFLRTLNSGTMLALPDPAWVALLPHIGWLYSIIMVLAVSVFAQHRMQKSLWQKNLMLQRPKTAEIDAGGITIQDDHARLEYRWGVFSKARETKNLFVLFIGPATYIMLPKSAFVMTDELNAMRTLMAYISQPGTGGFPVALQGNAPPVSS